MVKKKWEYKRTYSDTNLSKFGLDGWELVAIACDKNKEIVFYLKREIK